MTSLDFLEQDWGANGVVSFPEFFPEVGVGQVFPSSPSGETVDYKHTVSPDDDLLRSRSAQPNCFDCCEEFGPCN